MNRKLIVATLLAMGCSIGAARGQQVAKKEAKAHLKVVNAMKQVDVGLMKPDTIAEAPLLLVNEGNAPMTILEIFTDCHCTMPEYTHDPVAPGDTIRVNVKFNSRGRVPGAFRKAMRIRSNADNYFEVAFVIGKVARPVLRND